MWLKLLMIINDDMVDDDYMSFIIIYSFSIVFFDDVCNWVSGGLSINYN